VSKNIFPAVRGVQNGVEYFLTTLSYNQIRQFITLPQDYLGDELLDPSLSMQRELQWTRIRNEMKPYLLRPDAFYSSLTLIMLPPGLPESFDEGKDYIFRPLKRSAEAEEESDEEWDALFGAGELVIFNDFTLFPGDGQHRAASIIEALKDVEYLRRDPDLARVRVPVVIVPFRARPRVQQLFADLNLHAKVPNKSIGISFEHNDPRALATKMLLSAVPLLENRVNQRATSLPETSPHVVTLYALSQANDILLDALDDAGLIANLD
jgi:DGQHR domain-containing protein